MQLKRVMSHDPLPPVLLVLQVLNFWRVALPSSVREVALKFFADDSSRAAGRSLGLGLQLGFDGFWRVDDIDPAGVAFSRGLRDNDLVIGVNHWPLPESCDLPSIIASTSDGPLLLNVVVPKSTRGVRRSGERNEVIIFDKPPLRSKEATSDHPMGPGLPTTTSKDKATPPLANQNHTPVALNTPPLDLNQQQRTQRKSTML